MNCVTHHICDCLEAKLKRYEEALEEIRNADDGSWFDRMKEIASQALKEE